MAKREIDVSDLVIAIENKIDERGISDAQAARELNVKPQSLSQWKRGAKMDLTPALQLRMAFFLGVTPAEVLELRGWQVSTEPLDEATLARALSTIPGLLGLPTFEPVAA